MLVKINIKYTYIDYSNINNITGIVTDIYTDSNKIVLTIKSNILVNGTYYIQDFDKEIDIVLGDEVTIYGNMSIPSKNTNINLFNYQNFLKSKDIYYLFNISKIEKIKDNNNVLYMIKNKFIELINNNSSSNYLYTFILGDNRYIDKDVKSSYQRLGISHLFSISGMHVSILSGIILKILSKFKINELYKYILCCCFIMFYMFLVSFCPSALRSGIFFIFLSINKIFNFNIKPFNLLLLTVSLILFMNPFIIYNTGFLFSVIITASLIVFSSIINRYDNYLYRLLSTSFIAFLFSFPLSIYNYYQINLLTVLYNLIFVPIISKIIFPLSLLCFIFPFLSSIFEILINIVEYLAIKLSSLNTNIIFLKPSLIMVFIYYFIIYIVLYYRKKIHIFILFLILLVHYNYNIIFFSNYMLMIDVGQGDSLLLHSGKYNILVDTGGNYNNTLASNTLIPLFKSLGIRKIDYLFLSHGDYDHLGEAIKLIEGFEVNYVFFNEGEFNYNEKEIIELLDKNNINYSISYEGSYYKIGDYEFYSLGSNLDDENDSSMILYGKIKNNSFLLMGDASIKSEEVLLSKYSVSQIDILKVGHHGSKTSTGDLLVKTINPKYSLISVGKDNKFGHPNEEVLNVLDGSKIYRTDQDGSIMFKIKNNKLKIETCSQ